MTRVSSQKNRGNDQTSDQGTSKGSRDSMMLLGEAAGVVVTRERREKEEEEKNTSGFPHREGLTSVLTHPCLPSASTMILFA